MCDEAREVLSDLAQEFTLDVHEETITNDLALYERYKHRIPVLIVNGLVTLEGVITEDGLRSCLAAEQSKGR